MPKEEEEVASPDSKSKEPKKPKKKQPSVLIVFKVNESAQWAVYPRLFNDEETAETKLAQSYAHTEFKCVELDLS